MAERKYCEHCGQRVEWESSVNAGCTKILIKIARYLERKGHNIVNPKKEMLDENLMTSVEYNNLSHVVKHGLIAKVPNEPGNFSMTTRGVEYLHGAPIPRYITVQKATIDGGSKKVAESEETITITEAMKGEYWTQPNFEIREGRVIKKYPIEKNGQTRML